MRKPTPAESAILLYIAKTVTGVLILMTVGNLLNIPDVSWLIISMLLVLSPDSKEVVQLTVVRIKANLVASLASVLFLVLTKEVLVAICLSMVVTIVICYFFDLMTGARPALAAVIIILLHNQGLHLWSTAVERVAAVVAGCVFGLVLTYIFHREVPFRDRLFEKKVNMQE